MKHDWILIGLYLLILIVIVRELFSMIALTAVVVLLMVVQKIGLENLINSKEDERNRKLDDVRAKVDAVSSKVDTHRDDFNRQIVFVDNKVSEVRHFVDVEVNNAYNDLTRRLGGMEDKINEIRQLFSAAVGSLDERVQEVEQKDEEVFG